MSLEAASPENLDVSVRTPRELPERPIEYLQIPWLKFHALIEPYCRMKTSFAGPGTNLP